jgi:hypothetical protein
MENWGIPMDATLPLLAALLVFSLAAVPGAVLGLRWLLIRSDERPSRNERPTPKRPNHPGRRIPGRH